MDRKRVATILRKVRVCWQIPLDEILDASYDELAEELEEWPVDGVTSVELEQAVHLARLNHWWVRGLA